MRISSVTVHSPSPSMPANGRPEIVKARGVSINKLAETFGVRRQAINAFLNSRVAFTVNMAIRFEIGVLAVERPDAA